jgi:hypothetical protein
VSVLHLLAMQIQVTSTGVPRHDQPDTLTQEQQSQGQVERKENSSWALASRTKVSGKADFKRNWALSERAKAGSRCTENLLRLPGAPSHRCWVTL